MTLKKMNWNEVIPFSYKENKEIKSAFEPIISQTLKNAKKSDKPCLCLLYTSDAADER